MVSRGSTEFRGSLKLRPLGGPHLHDGLRQLLLLVSHAVGHTAQREAEALSNYSRANNGVVNLPKLYWTKAWVRLFLLEKHVILATTVPF